MLPTPTVASTPLPCATCLAAASTSASMIFSSTAMHLQEGAAAQCSAVRDSSAEQDRGLGRCELTSRLMASPAAAPHRPAWASPPDFRQLAHPSLPTFSAAVEAATAPQASTSMASSRKRLALTKPGQLSRVPRATMTANVMMST